MLVNYCETGFKLKPGTVVYIPKFSDTAVGNMEAKKALLRRMVLIVLDSHFTNLVACRLNLFLHVTLQKW
jgi:hypothetical protein